MSRFLGLQTLVPHLGSQAAISQTLTEQFEATNPTVYWPLTDAAGATLFAEQMGTGADAAISGATFAAGAGLQGNDCWFFDGVNDHGFFTAGQIAALDAVFDGDTGTLVVFSKAFQLANSDFRIMLQIGADSSNRITIQRRDNSTDIGTARKAQNVLVAADDTIPGTITDWNLIAISFDSVGTNELKSFMSNGSAVVQLSTTQAVTDSLIGSLASDASAIASRNNTPEFLHYGWLNHILYYNTVKDLAFLSNLATLARVI